MLGASYMLQTEASDDYKIPLYQEKVKRVTQFGQYVEENFENNYPVSWSEWLSTQGWQKVGISLFEHRREDVHELLDGNETGPDSRPCLDW